MKSTILLAAILSISTSAFAEDLIFQAVVGGDSSCTLSNFGEGTMLASNDQLSSGVTGGSPATYTVTASNDSFITAVENTAANITVMPSGPHVAPQLTAVESNMMGDNNAMGPFGDIIDGSQKMYMNVMSGTTNMAVDTSIWGMSTFPDGAYIVQQGVSCIAQ